MKKLPLLLTLTLVALALALTATRAANADNWQAKVEARLLAAFADDRAATQEFLVVLADQADLTPTATMRGKAAKGEWVYQTLTAHAAATQPPVLAALHAQGATTRPFWIVNMIQVNGSLAAVEAAARLDGVARVVGNWPTPLDVVDAPVELPAGRSIEWNINLIGAPAVWADGITGAGVVIGGQDTGYDWQHPALIKQYRGWNDPFADHNYNWHDAITSGGGGVCGLNAQAPCDDYGHGTHTVGTMVGNDMAASNPAWPAGATNAIGVAPGAQWVGCRNMDVGNGTPGTYADCFEWFVAPTDLQGNNPDPSKAPDVMNNSWSCTQGEGCTLAQLNVLQPAVAAARAAGIVVVVSAGNSGSSCSTVNTPAAIYDESFTVGATTNSNAIASYSSRGPVTIDGSGRAKPDIVAPGSSVRSSTPNGSYGVSSGTSMAAPHVAGLIALMIDANEDLRGEVDALEDLIRASADPLTSSQGCGGLSSTAVPNHVFGHGVINAEEAVTLALNYHPTSVTLATGSSVTPTFITSLVLMAAGLTLALAGLHWQRRRHSSGAR